MDSDTIRQMLSEATPGPWTMDERKHKCGAISARISAPEWDDFARVWVGLKDPAGARDDGIANARLIAAAPDLAAEVLRLRGALDEISGMGFDQPASGPDLTDEQWARRRAGTMQHIAHAALTQEPTNG
jgi:hypothetical protein